MHCSFVLVPLLQDAGFIVRIGLVIRHMRTDINITAETVCIPIVVRIVGADVTDVPYAVRIGVSFIRIDGKVVDCPVVETCAAKIALLD